MHPLAPIARGHVLIKQSPLATINNRSEEPPVQAAAQALVNIPRMSPPAWQTEELEDEWLEEEAGDDGNDTYGTRSISLTTPLATLIRTSSVKESPGLKSTHSAPGTFLVREDLPEQPIVLPKTPGRKKKGLIKDFFSPLPLERMFEPPSPPAAASFPLPNANSRPKIPSQLSQTHVSDSQPSQDGSSQKATQDGALFDDRNPFNGHFTFTVPRESSLKPYKAGAQPQAHSTPGVPFAQDSAPPSAPMTDPRLRLFQFQYDTFTRDHLSALVDSIAVNTPSGSNGSPASFGQGLSRVSEATGTAATSSHLRSSKRVKLSPPSDFYGEGDGAGAVVARPKLFGKDYVGESQSLMQKIKQARDLSTTSIASPQSANSGDAVKYTTQTPADARRPSSRKESELLSEISSGSTAAPKGSYSSYKYRQQAATLMAQIKSDMKGAKRVFSGDTDVSHLAHVDEKSLPHFADPEPVNVYVHIQDDRENRKNSSNSNASPQLPARSKTRHKASPRKDSKRVASGSELEHQLSGQMSNLALEDRGQQLAVPTVQPPSSISTTPRSLSPSRPDPSLLAPPNGPSYPFTSTRLGPNEDLNRFVSSSTASGTTLTVGSGASFAKHAGPAHIRRIAPEDVGMLPERVGKMVFDKVMMKWVKATAQALMGAESQDHSGDADAGAGTEGESEDPFKDIESLRGDDSSSAHPSREENAAQTELPPSEMAPIEEVSGDHSELHAGEGEEEEDGEEAELMSFSFDASAGVVHVMTGVETDDMGDNDETSDSEDEREDRERELSEGHEGAELVDQFDSEGESQEAQPQAQAQALPSRHPTSPARTRHSPRRVGGTPHPHRPSAVPATPNIRPVLKSTSATPLSALKDSSRHKYRTPAQRHRHRRSVSFSDGKREGPIQGVGRNSDDAESPVGGKSEAKSVPSARSKRIADMMGALEDTESDESPLKASHPNRPPTIELQPFADRGTTTPATSTSTSPVRQRVFTRASAQKRSPAKGNRTANKQYNATFLTECSFGVSHDKLVQVITDVQPFEPHWEELSSIDLSKKNLESVTRLKEFLPKLDSINLNSNQLSWLSGIPGSVRTLSVASNFITGITSYSHLSNLENLDISRNEIESLRQLECLRHLRELRADANKIVSTDGLQAMDGLVKLSLQGNCIRRVDLGDYRWTRLEMLNVSQNRVDNISGLASLPSLIALYMDDNELVELEPEGAMPRLRILRLSNNRLKRLDAAPFPNLRTLYVDNNALTAVVNADRLGKLENLSLRNQSGRGFVLTRHIRDVKRLYLSGNPLKTGFLDEPCYNLVYLELAACRLESLPANMGGLVPNLRVLNLNYNFLKDGRGLEGLTRLRKLTIIGSRLVGTKPLIRLLQRLPEVEMVDFRMNPCTLGWYLPLLVGDVPCGLEGKRGEGVIRKGEWGELDSKFRRDLPDSVYIGRLAYRGLVMRACLRLRMLDGVVVSDKERAKAEQLLMRMVRGDR